MIYDQQISPNILIAGDFNENILRKAKNNKIIKILEKYNLDVINHPGPTRVQGKKTSTIDFCIISKHI